MKKVVIDTFTAFIKDGEKKKLIRSLLTNKLSAAEYRNMQLVVDNRNKNPGGHF